MIVDARAIGIQQAKYLLVGQPVPFIPEAVSGGLYRGMHLRH